MQKLCGEIWTRHWQKRPLPFVSGYPLCPASRFLNFPCQLHRVSRRAGGQLFYGRESDLIDIPGNQSLRQQQACGAPSADLTHFESDADPSQNVKPAGYKHQVSPPRASPVTLLSMSCVNFDLLWHKNSTLILKRDRESVSDDVLYPRGEMTPSRESTDK